MDTMLNISNLEAAIQRFNQKSLSFSSTNENIIRVDTPFYDRHNDAIVIYAVRNDRQLRLTDGGYILDDLEADGVYLSRSQKRLRLIKQQLTAFSVELDDESHELYIDADLTDYPVKQNLLIQAMLFVNDMFVLSKKEVSGLFVNDVLHFLEDSNIRAAEGYNFIGKTGMVLHYDFSIAGIREIPDKLIRVMNTPKNDYYAKVVAMDVRQTIPVLKRKTDFYAFINDSDEEVDSKIIRLFESENIITVPFSKRHDFKAQLAE